MYYIIDYEYSNSDVTGLDMIKKYSISDHSMLATNYFENSELINQCKVLKLKIIPKIIFNHLDIISSKPEVYVIDDEKYFLLSLKSYLQESCILNTFSRLDEIKKIAHKLPSSGYYFIDRNLNGDNENSSEEFLNFLKERGFKNLFNISGDETYCSDKAIKISKDEIINFFN